MLLKAFEFVLITFGVTMVVSFIVASIIKAIAIVVRRGEKRAAESASRES